MVAGDQGRLFQWWKLRRTRHHGLGFGPRANAARLSCFRRAVLLGADGICWERFHARRQCRRIGKLLQYDLHRRLMTAWPRSLSGWHFGSKRSRPSSILTLRYLRSNSDRVSHRLARLVRHFLASHKRGLVAPADHRARYGRRKCAVRREPGYRWNDSLSACPKRTQRRS